MSTAVVAALLASVLFTAVAPALGRRLPPVVATRVLVVSAVAVAVSTFFVVGVVAFTWVARYPAIAALGPWSPAGLNRVSPIPTAAGAAATLLLSLLAARTCRMILPRGRELAALRRSCRHLRGTGSVVVVDSDEVDAFTTPQRRGRIVVTTALLRALDPAERRVVLAHETSHLHHRHPWWLLAAELAVAVNPLLGRTARTVAHSVERWADEEAARTVADRRLAARTLARTALLAHRGPAALPGAVGVLNSDVPARVHALLDPSPRRRPGVVTVLVALTLACVLSAAAVQQLGERLFEGLLHDYERGADRSVSAR
jgi:Zn-dependent protease with chaperone function